MRVALAILHADPARGGAERYTVELAASLAIRGHDVSVISTSFATAIPPQLRVHLGAEMATRTGSYKKFLDLLDTHSANAHYDIVHAMLPVRRCHVYHPHAGIAAEATGKWNALFNPRRRAMARVERELLTSAPPPPLVLSLSEYVKSDIRRHYPNLPAEYLVTLFNAVDLKKFNPATGADVTSPLSNLRADGRPYVWTALMVAQDFERKGLRQAIEALARIHKHAAPHRLVVVGNDDKQAYEALARQHQVDVQFVGGVEDPRPYYRAADFFILPTRHDPCSLVVLEALAMGVPVISTRNNGATEIMTDGVHGRVLEDPNDVGALAAAIHDLIPAPRRAAMREACLQLRSRLSYEHHLDHLETIYERARRTR